MIIKQVNDRLNVRYKDEYVGGQWLEPNGSTAPDKVTATIGGVNYLLYSFDGINTTESISNCFEINHETDMAGLNAGTVKAEWHVHGLPSTTGSGVVKFFLDYCYLPAFGSTITQTSLSTKCTIEANSQYKHCVFGAEIPKPSSGFNIGDMILFSLRRNPADAEDTYGADFLLLKTALHLPIDDIGSKERYTK